MARSLGGIPKFLHSRAHQAVHQLFHLSTQTGIVAHGRQQGGLVHPALGCENACVRGHTVQPRAGGPVWSVQSGHKSVGADGRHACGGNILREGGFAAAGAARDHHTPHPACGRQGSLQQIFRRRAGEA